MSYDYKPYTQVAINCKLALPENKPNIEVLLRATSTPNIEKTVVIDKRVAFAGQLCVGIEYAACVADQSQPLHFVLFEIPVNGIINHYCARAYHSAQMKAVIKFQEFQAHDARCISAVIVIKFSVIRFARQGECLPYHFCKSRITICKLKPIKCAPPPCHKQPKPNCCQPMHHCDSGCHTDSCTNTDCCQPMHHFNSGCHTDSCTNTDCCQPMHHFNSGCHTDSCTNTDCCHPVHHCDSSCHTDSCTNTDCCHPVHHCDSDCFADSCTHIDCCPTIQPCESSCQTASCFNMCETDTCQTNKCHYNSYPDLNSFKPKKSKGSACTICDYPLE